jgi:hypothetical protein
MWLKEVEENAEKDCLVMLVGNKMDLSDERAVLVRDGRSFARKNGLAFIETSALDSTGVDTAFQRILQEIYKTQTKKQPLGENNTGGKSGSNGTAGASGGGAPGRGQTIHLGATTGEDFSSTQHQKQNCCGGA